MSLSRRHVRLRVTGRVQGVFFRASTKSKASELGVKGFVKNEADGSVYIEAEGDVESVDKLITWVTAGGPPQGKVENIEVDDGELRGYERFEIRK